MRLTGPIRPIHPIRPIRPIRPTFQPWQINCCDIATQMAEIDQIIEKLRRQRSELDVAIGDTTLSGTFDEIVSKLEELRRRSDAVNGQRAPSAPRTSET